MRLESDQLRDRFEEVVGIEGLIIFQADDTPASLAKSNVSGFITQSDFDPVVNTAIKLNGESGAGDGKIHDHTVNRVLPPDGKAMLSKLAEHVPGFRFGAGFIAPELTGSGFGVEGHDVSGA